MRLQPVLVDLKKEKVKLDIPYVAIQPNQPECINDLNKRQFNLIKGLV